MGQSFSAEEMRKIMSNAISNVLSIAQFSFENSCFFIHCKYVTLPVKDRLYMCVSNICVITTASLSHRSEANVEPFSLF